MLALKYFGPLFTTKDNVINVKFVSAPAWAYQKPNGRELKLNEKNFIAYFHSAINYLMR